ncbi:hypothetical protein [Streptomyces sp. SYP-A7185]|uniref:hypothetical protein n=1 Tax=Streptomyces sp. SYP-A7185 TaxID=3040076 RepID=UPI0038F7BDF7
MDNSIWFEVEDSAEHDREPWDFDEAELAFLAALRCRAAAWRVSWAPSDVSRPEDDSSLLVRVSLLDEEHRVILGEWAVYFYGTHVQAGKVSDQLFNLQESGERGFFQASGTVDELARRCADWFESLLRRSVVRAEWPAAAGHSAHRWEFGYRRGPRHQPQRTCRRYTPRSPGHGPPLICVVCFGTLDRSIRWSGERAPLYSAFPRRHLLPDGRTERGPGCPKEWGLSTGVPKHEHWVDG